jgi:hypothetical protein
MRGFFDKKMQMSIMLEMMKSKRYNYRAALLPYLANQVRYVMVSESFGSVLRRFSLGIGI